MIDNVKEILDKIPYLQTRYTSKQSKANTITVLGSSRSTKELEQAMKASSDITRHFVEHGYNILTGCGTNGIMGAVYDAAAKYSEIVDGKPVQNLVIVKKPLWGDENIRDCVIIGKASSEETRINKFMRTSNTFIAFPGGATTIEEAATLIQNNKYPKNGETKTVILFGKDFWAGLIEQYKKLFETKILKENPIGKLFHIADSPEEVIRLIIKK